MLLVTEIEPEECARRCLKGDRAAFGQLYDALAPDVQRLIVGMRLGLDHQRVEDLVQESFLRLYRNLERLNLDRPLRPYLLGIGRNLAIDAWRRQRVQAGREEALLAEPAEGEGAGADAGRAEWNTRVGEALAALEPEARSVLVLRHTSGLVLRELAEVLECSVPTARNRLREAALLLAAELRRRGVLEEQAA